MAPIRFVLGFLLMDNYQITFQTWNKLAKLYETNFMDLDMYNDTYDRFCDRVIDKNASILEIGCGPGNITKYLLDKNPQYKIEGIDVAPDMIELAQKNNPKAQFRVMDCRNLDKLSGKYDAIMCGFCLPYLSKSDCDKLIRDSARLLSNQGVMYLSAIEGDYANSGFEGGSTTDDKAFVYYHQEDNLRSLFVKYGFNQIDVLRKDYTKRDGSRSIHLILIASFRG